MVKMRSANTLLPPRILEQLQRQLQAFILMRTFFNNSIPQELNKLP
jgi:hypothetical protein